MIGGYEHINAPVGTRFKPQTTVVHAEVHNAENVTLKPLYAVASTSKADDTELKTLDVSSLRDLNRDPNI